MRRLALNSIILVLVVAIVGIYLATQLPRLGVVFARAEPMDGSPNAGIWLAGLFEACVVLFGILIYQDKGHIAPKVGYGAFLLVTVWANLSYHYGEPFQSYVPIALSVALPLGASLLAIQFRQAVDDVIGAIVKWAGIKRGVKARLARPKPVLTVSTAHKTPFTATARQASPRAVQEHVEDVLAEHGYSTRDLRQSWEDGSGDVLGVLRGRVSADAVGVVIGKAGCTVRNRWRSGNGNGKDAEV